LKYGFRPSPVLDQNFLIDKGVLERETKYAEIRKTDTVLEIGPGLGFLTELISKQAGKVIAVEKDKRLEKILSNELKQKNIELIFEDCLKISFPKFDKIVSNIPYSISAPLTFKLLDYDFEKAVLCYQKEFAEKMVAKPGSSDYGRLSVMIQYYFNAEIKEIVPKTCFHPQPKVDSAIGMLSKKNMERDKKFDEFVREIFRYSSKNVGTAVKIAYQKELKDERKVFMLGILELKEIFEKIYV